MPKPQMQRPGMGKGPGGKGEMPKARKGTMGRVLRLLMEDYKRAFILAMVFMTLYSIGNITPTIFIKNITDVIERFMDGRTWADARPEILHILVVMIVVFALTIVCNYAYARLMAVITQGFLDKMRKRMFNAMQSLPIKYFDAHGHGDIMSHYTNDIDTLRQLVSQSLPRLFQSGVMLVGMLGIMLFYSANLMVVVLVGVFGMTFAVKHIGGKSASNFVLQQKAIGEVEGYVEEIMNGQKVVKVFCHEEACQREFDKVNDRLCEAGTKATRFANILGPVMGNIGNMLYVLIAIAGSAFIALKTPNYSIHGLLQGSFGAALELSVVISFLHIAKQFTGQVNGIAQQFNSIVMALAGADRIFLLMDEAPEADDGYVTLVNAEELPDGSVREADHRTGVWAWRHPHKADGTVSFERLRGDVRLFDVDFSYVEGKKVLEDVTLWAKPGQKIAFVGATGAGKTTITNLINRFYDLEDGKIRYDGINVTKIKKPDLRRSLGVVLQDVNLFTGTVMDNIRYGKLDATDEECIQAAKLANAHDFITRLPQGYDTMLTSNGANLSQGQRQLISIARAAVADPPVMILDEATSSIDTRTEAQVQQGMDALMKGRTVFVIAHRLSTVRNANAIMVLDHGKIIERGTHADLIAQKGTYYKLYTGAFELE
ncbi:MAG: ABC transporter ATP-binding protein [Oscillospiraceae bacterium]|nr:ABC transporter ATP-binding protein [Oscillospiraceae bacterium]